MEITNILTNSIINKTPISFSKYGDGEYFCANNNIGNNCDGDKNTFKLQQSLIKSFKYMVEELPNSYIGLWHDHNNKIFWEKLVNKPIKWAKYHSIIMDNDNFQEKLQLYKTIKYSKLKKIIICNRLLIKSKILLNIDYLIEIPFNNWFDHYFDNLMLLIINIINNNNNNEPYIIIFCCGMGAKVLICELSKIYPNFIYLDFGSALDKICTKHTTRGWETHYDDFIVSIREILPNNWNDEKFNNIYEESKLILGKHLYFCNI